MSRFVLIPRSDRAGFAGFAEMLLLFHHNGLVTEEESKRGVFDYGNRYSRMTVSEFERLRDLLLSGKEGSI